MRCSLNLPVCDPAKQLRLYVDTLSAANDLLPPSPPLHLPPHRSAAADDDVDMADADGSTPPSSSAKKKRVHSSKSRSMSRGRALSLADPSPNKGLKDAVAANKGIKMADKAQRIRNKFARIGEADRHIPTKMPKHLFSGKRPKGKTDRR